MSKNTTVRLYAATGAPPKPDELKMRCKAVLMLTDEEFRRLKQLSAETGHAVSRILRDAMIEKHPKIFKT